MWSAGRNGGSVGRHSPGSGVSLTTGDEMEKDCCVAMTQGEGLLEGQ